MSTSQAVDDVLQRINYPYAQRVRTDVTHLISNIPLIVKIAKFNNKDLMQLTGKFYGIQ